MHVHYKIIIIIWELFVEPRLGFEPGVTRLGRKNLPQALELEEGFEPIRRIGGLFNPENYLVLLSRDRDSNPGPPVYKTDALPLSYLGNFWKIKKL